MEIDGSTALTSLSDFRGDKSLFSRFSEPGSFKQAVLLRFDTVLNEILSRRDASARAETARAETSAEPAFDNEDKVIDLLKSIRSSDFRNGLSEDGKSNLDGILTALSGGAEGEAAAPPESAPDLFNLLKSISRSFDSDAEQTVGSVDEPESDEAESGEAEDAERDEVGEAETDENEADNNNQDPSAEGGSSGEIDVSNEEADTLDINDDLRAAMVRIAGDSPDGLGSFTETKIANTIGPNDYWENTGNSMVVKDGVKPSEAVADIFENPEGYTYECASSVVALSLKSQLEVLGPERFDEAYKDGLSLNGWADARIAGAETRREAGDGEFEVNGETTVEGDLAPFDYEAGDRLIPGDIYYFDKAGDADTHYQGWNIVYMGEEDGKHKFWTMEGIVEAELKEVDGILMIEDNDSILAGYYLAASRTDPNGGSFAS